MPRSNARAGMAGSGKTTFMQRLNAHLHEKQQPGYIINLDPAVSTSAHGKAASRRLAGWLFLARGWPGI
jgi:GTPase SAR1 family protein